MVKIVKELYASSSEEFMEATLTHSSGTSISLYRNGSAVLDTPESSNYSLLEDLSMDEQLMLWVQTAAGNLKVLQKLEWKPQE